MGRETELMRVAMLSVHTCPLAALGGKKTGGMNVYVRELSRELGRRGIQVDVYTRSENPAVPHSLKDTDLGPNVRVIHVVSGPEHPEPKAEIWHHLPSFVEGVWEFACQEGIRYDLIHSHYWLSGWVAEMLRHRWPEVSIVQMFHTLGYLKNLVAQSEAEREVPERIPMEREIVHFADRLVAATPLEREHLVQYYGADPGRITVIPPGVDLELFRPIPATEAKAHLGLPPDDHMVLFVGRIEPLKGIDTLLRAIALLVARSPDLRRQVCVSIIGGEVEYERMDDEMRRLNHLRADLGIADVVTFMGSRAQTELPYYYSAADVMVVPSHYESFGMVALEAAACGTPVIASNVGGLSFIVRDGETGFLIPEKAPQALADKLHLLLTRPALRREMGLRSTGVAQQYGWPRIADDILELYDSLLVVARSRLDGRGRRGHSLRRQWMQAASR